MPPPGPARARCGRRRSAPAPRRSSSSTSWSGCGAAARGGCWPRSGAPLDLDALLAALGRVHRLGLVLLDPQRLAVGGLELAVELLDRPLQAGDGVVAERPALPDPVEDAAVVAGRSEEHTSELQSRQYLVCRLLLEKKKHIDTPVTRMV